MWHCHNMFVSCCFFFSHSVSTNRVFTKMSLHSASTTCVSNVCSRWKGFSSSVSAQRLNTTWHHSLSLALESDCVNWKKQLQIFYHWYDLRKKNNTCAVHRWKYYWNVLRQMCICFVINLLPGKDLSKWRQAKVARLLSIKGLCWFHSSCFAVTLQRPELMSS